MNKNMLLAILIVIIIVIVGAFVFSGSENGESKNTQITILSQETQNGDQIQVELKDEDGNGLSNENITIIYGEDENYLAVTDNDGKAYLTLENESAGQNYIKVKYNGSEKYNGCSFEQYA